MKSSRSRANHSHSDMDRDTRLFRFPLNKVQIGPTSALGLCLVALSGQLRWPGRHAQGSERVTISAAPDQVLQRKEGRQNSNCTGRVQSWSLVIRTRAGGVLKSHRTQPRVEPLARLQNRESGTTELTQWTGVPLRASFQQASGG